MSAPSSETKKELRPLLHPEFEPPVLAVKEARESVAENGGETVAIAVEREGGFVSRFDLELPAKNGVRAPADWKLAERVVKLLLWSRGGWRIHLSAPEECVQAIASAYHVGGTRRFDARLMETVYERPLEVVASALEEVPGENESPSRLGGNLDGCRIGFDLGASDYKIAAMEDGRIVYSDEIPWTPSVQPDPNWHYERIQEGLRSAAARLPRVDAIGGSSAGVIVDNRLMTASLLRAVPPDRMSKAHSIFTRLEEAWKVPLVVLNDGEVTALAGGLSMNVTGVLGMAMGSSEATGYLDSKGRLSGWMNELAFAPVDIGRSAALDEWSGDHGVGAQYFSQQAVARLMPRARIESNPEEPLPDRLERVSSLADEGDERATAIFETIGSYLGLTLPWYGLFYDFSHVLILGRVTSGEGGRVIKARAQEVLRGVSEAHASRVSLHLPDEKSRRVGQAVAAASIPSLGGQR